MVHTLFMLLLLSVLCLMITSPSPAQTGLAQSGNNTVERGRSVSRLALPNSSPAFTPALHEVSADVIGTLGRVSSPVHSFEQAISPTSSAKVPMKTTKTTAKTGDAAFPTGTAEYASDGTLLRFTGKLGVLPTLVQLALKRQNAPNVESEGVPTFRTTFIKRSNSMIAAERAAQQRYQQTPLVQEILSLLQATNILAKMVSPKDELAVISAETDDLGMTHMRFEQTYKGVRIYGKDIYVHARPDGTVSSVHGYYMPTPVNDGQFTPKRNPSNPTSAAELVPAIDVNEAVNIAQQALHAEDVEAYGESIKGTKRQLSPQLAAQLGYAGPTSELILYPHNNRLRLCYAVILCPSISESWMYFVDAHSGTSLGRLQLHRYDNIQSMPESKTAGAKTNNSSWSDESLKASRAVVATEQSSDAKPAPGAEIQAGQFVNITGTDLFDKQVTVRAWQAPDNTIYPLSDESNFRETPAERLPRRPNGGHLVLDADGRAAEDDNLTLRTTRGNAPFSPQIMTALALTDSVLRYFRIKFNRTSWDGNGSFIQTIINIGGREVGEGREPGQAWWNPGLIAQGYGPGASSEGRGWRDLHLVGHEVGHAYNTPGRLDYSNDQSGAIEEHLANFWGWMVQSTEFVFPVLWGTNPRENPAAWHMSAEPDSCGEGNRNLPRTMNDFRERTDPRVQGQQFPHYNGPIVDRACWFFFRKYGRDTTARIWSRALTRYITQQTRFGAFRTAVVQAATDLFESNATLIADLNAAFDAVGITPTTGQEPPTRLVFAGKPVETAVQSGRSVVTFTTQSGRIGYYDPSTRRATYFTGNDAVVRTRGGRSQLSAPNTGNRLYFVNAAGRLAFLDLATSRVSVFSTLQIRTAGDIVSAVVSPDERAVVMTSQYDNDAAIYRVPLTAVGTAGAVERIPIERLAPTASTGGTSGRRKTEGKQISGIRFPDALSWSPDTRSPEVVLDAMSSMRSGRDTLNFWGVYVASFLPGRAPSVDEVYTPQPDFNLGFPTFSSRNPNTIAFGVTEDDTTDTYVANFDKPEDVGFLQMTRFSLSGRRVIDADAATFAPDDTQLALVSPSRPRDLLVYTFARAGAGAAPARLEAITLDSTVNRPYWAALTVATSVTHNAGGAASSAANDELQAVFAPNPLNAQDAQGTVQFSLQRSAPTTVKLYDMRGVEVATLLDSRGAPQAAGDYMIPLDATQLSCGIYICRIASGALQRSIRVVVVR